jgi:ferredoxin-NADP reductase
VPLTLPIRDVVPATARATIVRIGLEGLPFAYAPGQAILVGPHGQERRKPYSLAAAPEDAARDGVLELLVGVDTGSGSGPQFPLVPGTLVDVEGPVGGFVFPAEPQERRFVFVAGGTGIAPLRAMLRHALGTPHVAIGLLYSARTPADFAYEDEFRGLARAERIELRQTVTRAVSDGEWSGPRGRIGREALAALVHDPATLCFICGPRALVEAVPIALDDLGVPPERIRVERWG